MKWVWAIEIAVKIVKGEPYEKQVLIPFELVTRQNVAQYMK
jgi:inositol transport system substrate-binding protein